MPGSEAWRWRRPLPVPRARAPPPAEPEVPKAVLNELARGFLLELRQDDPRAAARFASQFLSEQALPGPLSRTRLRPRTARGPLPRASPDGRSLEPPPP